MACLLTFCSDRPRRVRQNERKADTSALGRFLSIRDPPPPSGRGATSASAGAVASGAVSASRASSRAVGRSGRSASAGATAGRVSARLGGVGVEEEDDDDDDDDDDNEVIETSEEMFVYS